MNRWALPPRLRPSADLSVLDITKFFGATTGGIRTYLLEKASWVEAQERFRQVLIVPAESDGIEESDGVRWYRLKGPRIPAQHPYRLLLDQDAIERIVQHEAPDIIEVGSPYRVPWLARKAARRQGIPLVWFYHTNLPRIISPRPERDGFLRRAGASLAERYLRRLAGIFDAAVAASDAGVLELTRAGCRHVKKIPLGVDLAHFHPRRRETRERTRSAAGLPDGQLVLYAGRLAREKELDLVVDAWPRVEAETGAHLALIGDGPSKEYFQHRSRARGVSWLGHVPDRERLADLIAAADLYVAPGPAETFGLAAVEALASGVPVLASDQGAVRELVEASGAGAVNPQPTAAAMGESVISLLGRDLRTLGDRGRRYAESHHAWPAVFERLFQLYHEVIAARA